MQISVLQKFFTIFQLLVLVLHFAAQQFWFSTLLSAQHQTAGRHSDQACGEEHLAAKQADISP